MRVLIVHHEARYFGGAEVLLGHFLLGLGEAGAELTVALARESRLASAVPAGARIVRLPASESLTLTRFSAQLRTLARDCRLREFDIIHGWAARNWELAAMAGALAGCVTVGTIHDHPRAHYISRKRQVLMRLVANRALDRIACPSEAVRIACVQHDYRPEKLVVVHNGVPVPGAAQRQSRSGPIRFGFLGTMSQGKGLGCLFEMVDHMDRLHPGEWELRLGGVAQDDAGERLVASIKTLYSAQSWWPRVNWCGWVEDQLAFLREVDVLVCPSAEFEAFGLVLCEAAAATVPAVATRVGAVPEIVLHGQTGWLFQPGDWRQGARLLADLIREPDEILRAGEAARLRVAQRFAVSEMVSGYLDLYSGLS